MKLRILENPAKPTSELLKGLNSHSGECPLEHATSEAVSIAGFAEAHLIVVVGLDLPKLVLDRWVVRGQPAQLAQRDGGLVHVVPLDQVSRSFWEQKHSDDENDGPCELDSDGDPV